MGFKQLYASADLVSLLQQPFVIRVCFLCCLLLQPMSEDYPASSDGGSDDGGYDGLMDDKDEKELMVECGQRQVLIPNSTCTLC